MYHIINIFWYNITYYIMYLWAVKSSHDFTIKQESVLSSIDIRKLVYKLCVDAFKQNTI